MYCINLQLFYSRSQIVLKVDDEVSDCDCKVKKNKNLYNCAWKTNNDIWQNLCLLGQYFTLLTSWLIRSQMTLRLVF